MILIFLGTLALGFGQNAWAEQAGCFPKNFSQVEQDMQGGLEIIDAQRHMKTSTEVDAWMGCFGKSSALNQVYLNQYRPYVERAAQSFHLPYQILACLFFSESKWDKQATSEVKASGLAQIMDTTIPAINIIVTSTDQIKALDQRMADHLVELKRRKLSAASAINLNALSELDAELELNVLRAKMQKDWQAYWSNVPAPPTAITHADLLNPERAVAAGALILKYILMKNNFGKTGSLTELLIAAGAYNYGPAAMQLARKKAHGSYPELLRVLKESGNTETPQHMEAIRHCLEKGDQSAGDPADKRICKL